MDLDIEKLREEVKGIEAEIKSMIGQSGGDVDYVDIPECADRGRLKELLMSRRHSLDMLFRRDPEGVERFRKVNACFTGSTLLMVWTKSSTMTLWSMLI